MRSVIHDSFGDPAEVLHPADSVRPEPASGEVLIRVRASAVNNTDVNTRTGWYSKAVRGDTGSAATTGYDGASDADGVIEAVETDPRRYPDHWVVAVQWHPEERLDDLRLFAGLVQASSAFAQRKTQKVSA
ncbi:gamma-glutamyl-gamma-aminobutyrate hydrolase family protein [Mycolicibacterium poriferae]|uniref:gamma-glutamyl-gamma-aminobutyrate hydrolase family protein n=1 Tax=Mycolicibacterium poriferae TaxID=39694 RepID=UPI003D2ECD75